jgi:hypothetical protein
MASDNDLPLSGENVPVTLFCGGKPVGQAVVRSFKLSENATEHDDSYLGADSDAVDKQTNNWTASVVMDVQNGIVMQKLEENDAARRARKPIPSMALQYTLQGRNGEDVSFMLSPCICIFDLDASGRKDRVKLSLKIKARRNKRVVG